MTIELPLALQSSDKMGLKACLKFLGCCALNGILEPKIFYEIMSKLSHLKSNLVALAFLTVVPIFQKLSPKKNPLIENYMDRIGKYIEENDKPVPEYLRPFRKFDKERDVHIACVPRDK